MKFFGVSYIGAFTLGFLAIILDMQDVAIPLITLGMLGALAQLFCTYEDLRMLDSKSENEYQLQKTKRLYEENFIKVKQFRLMSLILGGILFPLLVIVLVSSASFLSATLTLLLALILVFASEISDRFLFYSTVVPLGMAGGFFVGKQRG
jgi:DMSO reductase anchor subunit